MSIRKGQDWGRTSPLPDGAPTVRTDAELRALVAGARHRQEPLPVVGLLGGDLCRTVGGRGDVGRLRGPDARQLPVDIVRVDLDDLTTWFVAHLVLRRSWWRGPLVAVMNAEWLGSWDVAPRAHPGDGRVDVLEVVELAWRDRLRARRRLPSGTHVPHPGIRERRVSSLHLELDRPTPVALDGTEAWSARQVHLAVEADALTVVV